MRYAFFSLFWGLEQRRALLSPRSKEEWYQVSSRDLSAAGQTRPRRNIFCAHSFPPFCSPPPPPHARFRQICSDIISPLPPFVLPAPMKNSPCSAVVILPSSSPSHQPRQEDVFDAGHKKRRKRRKEGLRQNPFPLPLPLSAISGLTYGLCLPCGFPKWKCLLDLGKRRRALLAVGI